VLYSLYGSVLYVVGPLVLALYPAMSTTPLARTYLTNLIVFQSWGLIYAIMGCLMWAINMGTVGQVLGAGSAGGFFAGASQTLLLALTSILFALCIGLIPFLARRIVQGDVGSTMFAVVGVAATAATMAAQAAMGAMGGFGKASGSGGEAGSAAPTPSGPPPTRDGGIGSAPINASRDPLPMAPTPPSDRGSASSTGAAPVPYQEASPASGAPTRARAGGQSGHRAHFSYMHALGWAFGSVLGQGYRAVRGAPSSRD
jgi:hypothetical protein